MKTTASVLFLLATGLLWQPCARAEGAPRTLQCWTDAHGQRACGDSLPPQEARRQRELIDARGVVKKVLPAEKTQAQLAEETRTREERARQDAYDQYLTQTYQNVGELEKGRDDRLAVIDTRLALARKALADNTRVVNELRQRDQAPPAAGETPDPSLKRQIREFSQAREENQSAIARMQEERTALTAQFARDIQRYQSLRNQPRLPVPGQ